MAEQGRALRVVCGGRERQPRSFWWQERSYRVLGVQGLRVVGSERRYRLATSEGCFELALTGAGSWRMCRAPSWPERMLARFANGPRYPLPAWRRRRYRSPVAPAGCACAREARRGPAALARVRQAIGVPVSNV